MWYAPLFLKIMPVVVGSVGWVAAVAAAAVLAVGSVVVGGASKYLRKQGGAGRARRTCVNAKCRRDNGDHSQ